MAGSREPCRRCGGAGEFMVRLGLPGQDPRLVGGHANIEWDEPTGPHQCGVCLGTGWVKEKTSHQPAGAFHAHYTPADTMSMEEIFDAMSLACANGEEPDEQTENARHHV